MGDHGTEAVPVEVKAARLLLCGDGEERVAGWNAIAEEGGDERDADAPVRRLHAFKEMPCMFDTDGGEQQKTCEDEEQRREGLDEGSTDGREVCTMAATAEEEGDRGGCQEAKDPRQTRDGDPPADDGAEEKAEGEREQQRPKKGFRRSVPLGRSGR